MTNKNLLISISLLTAVFIYLFFALFSKPLKEILYKPLCPNCNIILISVDTLGAKHLPCYGYKRNTAPNLCSFAGKNVIFRDSYSNAGWTLPSHFSIFTSLYPKHHRIEKEGSILNEKFLTLTEVLKQNGYSTMYVGPIGDPYLPLDKGLGRGFDKKERVDFGIENWDKGYAQLLNNEKNKKKTFLFLHTYWVHDPYVVDDLGNKEGKRLYAKGDYPELVTSMEEHLAFSKGYFEFVTNKSEHPAIIKAFSGVTDFGYAKSIYDKLNGATKEASKSEYYFSLLDESPERVEFARDLYDELIFYFDKKLKDLFDFLSKNGLSENTIIVITSDHGEEFKEHGVMGHPVDHLYNTTTMVPLIMGIPGMKSVKIDEMVQSIDIAPTVLSLTGAKIQRPTYFEGIDLTDLIAKRPFPKKNNHLISQGPNDSIRKGEFKLYLNYTLSYGQKNCELYDVTRNPEETNNVCSKKYNTAKSLSSLLERIIYKK